MSNAEPNAKSLPSLHPLDAMVKAPDHHKVLLENSQVRVLDTHLGPGEQTPIHAHQWPATLYILSWSDFVRYDPEGKILVDSRTMANKPTMGEAIWASPLPPHCVRNVGHTDLRIIAIEVKS